MSSIPLMSSQNKCYYQCSPCKNMPNEPYLTGRYSTVPSKKIGLSQIFWVFFSTKQPLLCSFSSLLSNEPNVSHLTIIGRICICYFTCKTDQSTMSCHGSLWLPKWKTMVPFHKKWSKTTDYRGFYHSHFSAGFFFHWPAMPAVQASGRIKNTAKKANFSR